jgi:hypothetical protein
VPACRNGPRASLHQRMHAWSLFAAVVRPGSHLPCLRRLRRDHHRPDSRDSTPCQNGLFGSPGGPRNGSNASVGNFLNLGRSSGCVHLGRLSDPKGNPLGSTKPACIADDNSDSSTRLSDSARYDVGCETSKRVPRSGSIDIPPSGCLPSAQSGGWSVRRDSGQREGTPVGEGRRAHSTATRTMVPSGQSLRKLVLATRGRHP